MKLNKIAALRKSTINQNTQKTLLALWAWNLQ
jgi:hypothetical protein